MHLLDSELRNKEEWEAAGIELPKFDREAMKAATRECPQWVHFGAGNIFRAFPAACQQKLLNDGVEKTGIIVAEGYDYEIIKKAYRPQDDLSLLVTLKANGTIEKTVIGSLAQSLTVDRQDAEDWNSLKDIFASKTLQMVSFTITEKGYSITSADGSFRPDVKADFEAGPEQADSYIGKLSALCYWRYTHGAARWPWSAWITVPITAISCMRLWTLMQRHGQRTERLTADFWSILRIRRMFPSRGA